jgi:hypothetical protein
MKHTIHIVAPLLGAALSIGISLKLVPFNPITPERKATHMISYLGEEGEEHFDACTGTAVGPHALLTAVHCDKGDLDTIRLDLSKRLYHIIGAVGDGRDHVIYHLDGPAFINTVNIHEREAVLGEKVVSYGNGGDYPQHTYFGSVIAEANGGDTSDVDAADGTRCFSLHVVPGDSGSAIYGADGSIVALVTYGDPRYNTATGFALAFPPAVLEEISK